MTLKSKAALTYIMPLVLIYLGLVSAIALGKVPSWSAIATTAVPASGLLLVCNLLQDVVPKKLKEILVFWRFRERLPGFRAFSVHCKDDPRISEKYLTKRLAECSAKQLSENQIWYGLYTQVSKEPSVEHESFRYLAWRDAVTTLVLLGATSPALATLSVLNSMDAAILTACCFGLALLAIAAARNAANSLLRNVVALTANRK